MNTEIIEKRIRLPYRFGRLLYDRFNDTYDGTRTSHLAAQDVAALLDDTPQGVYQIGFLTSGPLGLIRSEQGRLLPPELNLPLWHCSDTGCGATHTVSLLPPTVPVVEAYASIDKALIDLFGPPAEWAGCLRWAHREGGRAGNRRYVDLPALMVDAVIDQERTSLVEAALQSPARDAVMKVLTGLPSWKEHEFTSPSELASTLTTEEQLQLMLVLPDVSLVRLMDDLAQKRLISVAPGDIRRSKYPTLRFSKDALSELGPLCVRSYRENPVVSLTSVIIRAYRSEKLENDLAWRVGADSNTSLEQRLSDYMRDTNPEEAVTKLILVSFAITSFVASELGLRIEASELRDPTTSDRILWKLGFDRPQFDDILSRFNHRLDHFNQTVLTSAPIVNEEARETVRSSGVNLFISVEAFLDSLLTFNVWLLASDHFLETKFRYDASQARGALPKILGQELPSGNTTVSWNAQGDNNIGVLLRYLSESVSWMDTILNADRSGLLRLDHELPHFADNVNLPFPFRHRALWADCDPSELHQYLEGYRRIVRLLEQANPGLIRNGLDHVREDRRFPGSDSILACIARLREALELADVGRYVPKVFWMQTKTDDRNRSFEYELRDYGGRILILRRPAMVSGLPTLGFEQPLLVPARNLLGAPNSELAIRLSESNVYDKYWEGYPRRGKVVRDTSSAVNADEVISSGH